MFKQILTYQISWINFWKWIF